MTDTAHDRVLRVLAGAGPAGVAPGEMPHLTVLDDRASRRAVHRLIERGQARRDGPRGRIYATAAAGIAAREGGPAVTDSGPGHARAGQRGAPGRPRPGPRAAARPAPGAHPAAGVHRHRPPSPAPGPTVGVAGRDRRRADRYRQDPDRLCGLPGHRHRPGRRGAAAGNVAYLAVPKTPQSDRTVPVTAATIDVLAAHLAEFPAAETEVEDRSSARPGAVCGRPPRVRPVSRPAPACTPAVTCSPRR